MTPDTVATVARETIVALLLVASPVMILALVVGLIIGLIQALTSIQESTLTFVPKIIIVLASLVLLLPFMAGQLNELTLDLFARMARPDAITQTDGTT